MAGRLTDGSEELPTFQKIICATMPFFNELDLLECRLAELYEHVDYFIITESCETFQGKPKPLYFLENRERYSQYLDKIRHVITEPLPASVNTWARERHQRNACFQALYDAEEDDILLIMDADEIVRATKLPEIVTLLKNNNTSEGILFLSLYGSNQFINSTYGQWVKAYAAMKKTLNAINPDHIRINDGAFKKGDNILENAGWHFSSLGGIQCWKTKFESFSHVEANTEEYKSAAFYFDFLKRKPVIEIDETFPQYIQSHIHEFEEKGYILTEQQTIAYGLTWRKKN